MNFRREEEPSPHYSERVAALNDSFRKTLTGGTVLITAGIIALDAAMQARIIEAVQAFDAFTHDNDPWNEHDMGMLDLGGLRVLFKIDYYDPTRARHSDDLCDPSKTERVLTIMLVDEY